MAYVQVEADDVRALSLSHYLQLTLRQRLEEGPEGLQFKCTSDIQETQVFS